MSGKAGLGLGKAVIVAGCGHLTRKRARWPSTGAWVPPPLPATPTIAF